MMNYTNDGERIQVTLGAGETVSSGDLFEIEQNLYGVAQSDGNGSDPDLNPISLMMKGRFNLTMTAGLTGSAGDPVYHDPAIDGVSLRAVGQKVGVLASDVVVADVVADTVLTPDGGVFTEGVATLDGSAGLGIGNHVFGPFFPIGAVLIEEIISVETTFVSATDAATIALGFLVDAVGQIDAAIAISAGANPWDAGAREGDGITDPLTARRQMSATVAVEATTAGALTVAYRYFVAS